MELAQQGVAAGIVFALRRRHHPFEHTAVLVAAVETPIVNVLLRRTSASS